MFYNVRFFSKCVRKKEMTWLNDDNLATSLILLVGPVLVYHKRFDLSKMRFCHFKVSIFTEFFEKELFSFLSHIVRAYKKVLN